MSNLKCVAVTVSQQLPFNAPKI